MPESRCRWSHRLHNKWLTYQPIIHILVSAIYESVEPDESLDKGESVEKSESVILKGNDIVDTNVMKTAEESGNAKLSSMIIKIKLESFLLLIIHVRVMALFFIVTDVIFEEKIIILPIIDVFGQ